LNSSTRVGVVQGRNVDRNWRFELGVNYTPLTAGDSYLNTQNLGGQIDLHIAPQFSLGVRYSQAFNNLTQEGQAQFDRAHAARVNGDTFTIPNVDVPKSELLGVANWYMFYGKMNFFDISVVQFDIYSLAGYGQMQLNSGSTPTWTAGGGIGFWLSQHFTSRFEVRYQNYKDQLNTDSPRSLNVIAANVGFGVLL
jgi:outer membrane beta-barrel protein